MPSTSQALIFITGFLVSVGLLVFVPPVKWLVKRWIPQPGEGPTEELSAAFLSPLQPSCADWVTRRLFLRIILTRPEHRVMQNGFIQSTNLTIATDPKSNSEPVCVKSILKGHGDPGYLLSSSTSSISSTHDSMIDTPIKTFYSHDFRKRVMPSPSVLSYLSLLNLNLNSNLELALPTPGSPPRSRSQRRRADTNECVRGCAGAEAARDGAVRV